MNIEEIRQKFPQYQDLSDGELVRGLHSKFYSDIPYPQFLKSINFKEKVDPTEGMSGYDKFAAGAGKAVTDLGMGVKQLVSSDSPTLEGLVTGDKRSKVQREVDEKKSLDSPLMDTGAGVAGHIAGNVAMSLLPGLGAVGVGKNVAMPALQAAGKLALTAPATMTGAAVGGGMGAAQGLLQPVATGDSRAVNGAVGLIGGAAVPAAGMALKAGKGLLEPLYQGGRDAIVGRTLRSAAGDTADQAVTNLKNAKTLVPGSEPTAAEVANSGGIAALQRTASAIDPEAYATRAAQQNEARVGLLDSIAGSPGQKNAADAARNAAASPHYDAAFASTIVGLPPQLKAEVQELAKRPAVKAAITEALTKAANEGAGLGKDAFSTVKGMHYVKRAIDDQIATAAPDDARILRGLQEKLLSTVDTISPEYAAGRKAYAAASKPINQMDVASEIADKSVNKLTGTLQPQAYAKALSDDTAARATGFSKSTLANTMEPQQLSALEGIKGDLARSVAARDMGRGAGSDTVQKMAMTNLMQQSGLPVGLLNMPGLGRLGNWVYSSADEEMKRSLATGLLNPSQTAKLMEKATPSEKSALMSGLLRMTAAPAVSGGTQGLLSAQ